MKKILISLFLIFFATLASAENRGGFYLAGGFGLGNTTWEWEADDGFTTLSGEVDSGSGFITSLKVGGTINHQHAIYYTRQAIHYTVEDSFDEEYSVVNGIAGIGYTYYFSPSFRTGYIEAALGVGDLILDQEIDDAATGSAYLLGIGYEVGKHAQLGLFYMRTDTEDPYDSNLSYINTTTALKVEFKI